MGSNAFLICLAIYILLSYSLEDTWTKQAQETIVWISAQHLQKQPLAENEAVHSAIEPQFEPKC